MFVVIHHMEIFSNNLGHTFIGALSDEYVIPQEIGKANTYNEALNLAYEHLYSTYPYQNTVKVEMRRNELVGYLRDDPIVEQHYTIKQYE